MAVLVFDQKGITHSDIEKLMSEIVSWDLCDHLCKNLIVKMKDYEELVYKWITSAHIYKKRAAYTLIATSAIHDKKLSDDTLDMYLKLIRETQNIEHEHIKKAVTCALKEIGKKDFNYNEKTLWVAKAVVKVEGRARLISTKTQMGSEA